MVPVTHGARRWALGCLDTGTSDEVRPRCFRDGGDAKVARSDLSLRLPSRRRQSLRRCSIVARVRNHSSWDCSKCDCCACGFAREPRPHPGRAHRRTLDGLVLCLPRRDPPHLRLTTARRVRSTAVGALRPKCPTCESSTRGPAVDSRPASSPYPRPFASRALFTAPRGKGERKASQEKKGRKKGRKRNWGGLCETRRIPIVVYYQHHFRGAASGI